MANARRKFDDLIMDDHGGCSKSDVLAAIVGSTSFEKLHEDWRSVATHLGLPGYRVRKLSEDYLLEIRIKTLPQLVDELLTKWKAERGNQAKITYLCDALEKCGLTDISQSLSCKFDVDYQKEVHQFIWCDRQVTLDDLLGKDEVYGKVESDQIPEPKGTHIIKPHLTPPSLQKYYVPRTLFYIPSHEIDCALFLSESTRNHVFLFNDITKSDLAKLTKYQFPIEFSGNQRHIVRARFILLECAEDYDMISKNTIKPVHLIQWEDERFLWAKSSAAIDVIQRFLRKPSKDISEEELANKIISLPPPFALSIAGSPGMGKTLVLASLATQIQSSSSDNTMHIFIVLQEFAQQLNLVVSETSALENIAAYCATDPVTEKLLVTMFAKMCPVHLYLDGYDEVLSGKLDLVDEFLKHVYRLQNFKVIVTTRSHLRTRLEIIFNQFSYKIRPFIEANQIDFLVRYWAEQRKSEYGGALEQFASLCLSELQNSMSDGDRAVAGIPLQCMMLGDVYAEDAKRASRLKSLRPDSVTPITLIQMYKRLIDLKFSRIPPSGCKQSYINAHIHKAILLLFPDWIEKFKTLLGGYNEIDETKLFFIGLLEQTPTTTPRFVHRTFAEYLVAEFIVNNLGKHRQCVQFLFKEVFGLKGTIRKREKGDTVVIDFEDIIYKLKYPAISHFIELLLKEYAKSHSMNELQLLGLFRGWFDINSFDHCATVIACCSNDLEYTFKYVTSVPHTYGFLFGLKNWYFKVLPHILIYNSNNVAMLEKVFEFSQREFWADLNYHALMNWKSLSWKVQSCTPLHLAILMGKQNMVTLLVSQLGKKVLKFKNLLHVCVQGSASENMYVINEKLLIIDMLVEINRKWLEEKDENNCTPLLQYGIHLSLLQRLVQRGADINAYSNVYGTILHTQFNNCRHKDIHLTACRTTISRFAFAVACLCSFWSSRLYNLTTLSYDVTLIDLYTRRWVYWPDKHAYSSNVGTVVPGAYLDLLRWAFSSGFSKINHTDKWSRTPIMIAIEAFGSVEEGVLNLFREGGVDFNAQDANGDSVLFHALSLSKSTDFIKTLLRYGVDLYHRNNNRQNAAHTVVKSSKAHSMESAHVVSVLMFLEADECDIFNQTDSKGRSPLDLAREQNLDEGLLRFLQARTSRTRVRENIPSRCYFKPLACFAFLSIIISSAIIARCK